MVTVPPIPTGTAVTVSSRAGCGSSTLTWWRCRRSTGPDLSSVLDPSYHTTIAHAGLAAHGLVCSGFASTATSRRRAVSPRAWHVGAGPLKRRRRGYGRPTGLPCRRGAVEGAASREATQGRQAGEEPRTPGVRGVQARRRGH